MEASEHNALTSDHVKVVLGPVEEVRLVRWMFRQCAAGMETDAITRQLNARRLRPAAHAIARLAGMGHASPRSGRPLL